jgi:hypothetical protein
MNSEGDFLPARISQVVDASSRMIVDDPSMADTDFELAYLFALMRVFPCQK